MDKKQTYFTIEEVADLFKVNRESVRRWVRCKKLSALKLGGKYIRINSTDLDAFINKSKV